MPKKSQVVRGEKVAFWVFCANQHPLLWLLPGIRVVYE